MKKTKTKLGLTSIVLVKILIAAFIYLVLLKLLSLPYINIVRIYFEPFPYLAEWLLLLVLFRPDKKLFLPIAAVIWVLGGLLAYLGWVRATEISSDIVFLLLLTFLLSSYNELRAKT